MNRREVYKIVMVGCAVILTPFLVALVYSLYFSIGAVPLIAKLSLLGVGFFYWAFMAPWYKTYAIDKLNTKEEYFLWKRLSVHCLLLWPDSFFGTKYEMWDDEKYDAYKSKVENLGVK